jgi:hypothetical protein
MPSIPHEAPLELLRSQPLLAAVLLRSQRVAVPASATASLASSEATSSVPTERRADAVVVLADPGGPRLAVVIEVQLRYDADKLYSWPTYVVQARAAHRCPAVLLVICPTSATARRCRAPILTGHPGFDLAPLVIDSTTMPAADLPETAPAGPEVAVLGVLTGALDLGEDSVRRQVLASLANLEADRLKTYTVFILNAASPSVRKELEALMTTTEFHNDFVDRLMAEGTERLLARGKAEGKAEGTAEGLAQMILRVLSARGVETPPAERERVLRCSDTSQLATWGDRAATATSIDDVFGA